MSVLALSNPPVEATSMPGSPAAMRPSADNFFTSYDDIRAFVMREWERPLDYRLKQQTWTYQDDRISVCFTYDWHDPDIGGWVRTTGTEDWVIGADGLIRCLHKAISDAPTEKQIT